MAKWKRNATKFTVSVNYYKTRGYQSSIPKPIIQALGDPEKITFRIDEDGRVQIEPQSPMSKREKKGK